METGIGATLPDYPTTGAAGMGLFPMQNTRLEPGVPTLVDTGVKFELPFMLVAHVVGKPEMALMRVLVHGDYISCDDKSPICVLMTLDAASEAVEVLTTLNGLCRISYNSASGPTVTAKALWTLSLNTHTHTQTNQLCVERVHFSEDLHHQPPKSAVCQATSLQAFHNVLYCLAVMFGKGSRYWGGSSPRTMRICSIGTSLPMFLG